jgi:putative iron-regulated protein
MVISNGCKCRARLLLIMPLLLSWVFLSCNAGQGETRVSTSDVLRDLAFDVILATYNELKQRGQKLQTAIETLSANVTAENVQNAREAWRAAREPWESNEGLLIGPVETEGVDPAIDSWPADTTGIKAILSSGNDLTPEFVSFLDGSLKGFHTMEYLLFTTGGDAAEDVAAYLSANPQAVQSLHSLIVDFNSQVSKLVTLWTPGEGDYADELANAGRGGATCTPASRPVSQRS